MLKDIMAAFASIGMFFTAAHSVDDVDLLQATSVGAARDSFESSAVFSRCRPQTDDAKLLFEGLCFGIPGEVRSEFEFAKEGSLLRSSFVIEDPVYLRELWHSLEQLYGRPQERHPARDGISWTVGRESWIFVPLGHTRWVFTREAAEGVEARSIKSALMNASLARSPS